MDPSSILTEELETQKKICANIEESTKMCNNHYKEIDYRLKKISVNLQELVETHKDLVKETKRHNQKIEYIRSIEMENNLELTKLQIEVEEIKVKNLKN